ncbi:MAG TPA: hypothetical protein VH234_01330 [Candidatus Saccharimonadales bacterium]|jgi:hypothetical protein|nr:hypothetical protein [Candidatus Saccharimonadales bacterium]
MDSQQEQSPARTKRGLALPQLTLSEAEKIASALHDLATAASKEAIASHIGVSPSGGKFKQRVASARYYGLVQGAGNGRLGLTELGGTLFMSDPEAVSNARQDAVMSTNFGPIMHTLRGRDASSSTVGIRLIEDYGIPSKAAGRIADVLLATAIDTGLARNGKFDVTTIEAHEHVLRNTSPTERATKTINSPKLEFAGKKRATPPSKTHTFDTNSASGDALALTFGDAWLAGRVPVPITKGADLILSQLQASNIIRNPKASQAIKDLVDALEDTSQNSGTATGSRSSEAENGGH